MQEAFVFLFLFLLGLGLLILGFLEEVEADNEFECAVVVGKSEVAFSVMVGMQFEHHSGEIMGVVPEETGLGEEVGTEVFQS